LNIVKQSCPSVLYTRILCTLWFSDYTYNQNEVYFLLALSCIGSFTLPSYEYWEMMQSYYSFFWLGKLSSLLWTKTKWCHLQGLSLVPTLHFSTVQFIWKKYWSHSMKGNLLYAIKFVIILNLAVLECISASTFQIRTFTIRTF
jgi:hypothetical protein